MQDIIRKEVDRLVSYNKLKKEALEKYCRSCLNELYGLSLERADCEYLYYPAQCKYCRNVKNIVRGVKLTSRWKLL